MKEKTVIESTESFLERVVMNRDNWKERKISDLKKGTRSFSIVRRAAIVETKRPHSPDKIIVLMNSIFPITVKRYTGWLTISGQRTPVNSCGGSIICQSYLVTLNA